MESGLHLCSFIYEGSPHSQEKMRKPYDYSYCAHFSRSGCGPLQIEQHSTKCAAFKILSFIFNNLGGQLKDYN